MWAEGIQEKKLLKRARAKSVSAGEGDHALASFPAFVGVAHRPAGGTSGSCWCGRLSLLILLVVRMVRYGCDANLDLKC